MSVNKVILIGHVGVEPEIRYLDGGVCVAKVRLATTERGYTLQNGTQEKYVHTGDKLYVEGKLQYRKYTDKQGVSRTLVEIMANTIEILSSAQPKKPTAETGNTQQAKTEEQTGDAGKVAEGEFEFPF